MTYIYSMHDYSAAILQQLDKPSEAKISLETQGDLAIDQAI